MKLNWEKNCKKISKTYPLSNTDFFKENSSRINWRSVSLREDLFTNIDFINEFKEKLFFEDVSDNLAAHLAYIDPDSLSEISDRINWSRIVVSIKDIRPYLKYKEDIGMCTISLFELPEDFVKEHYNEIRWTYANRANCDYLTEEMVRELIFQSDIVPFINSKFFTNELAAEYFEKVDKGRNNILAEFMVFLRSVKDISEESLLSIIESLRRNNIEVTARFIRDGIKDNQSIANKIKKWDTLNLFLTI